MPPYIVLKTCIKTENIDLSTMASKTELASVNDDLMDEINNIKDDLIESNQNVGLATVELWSAQDAVANMEEVVYDLENRFDDIDDQFDEVIQKELDDYNAI